MNDSKILFLLETTLLVKLLKPIWMNYLDESAELRNEIVKVKNELLVKK
ncbi:hypothetical protein [Coxiella-like endosymbiont]|nr:hypothetical protein [Coxiella-like endosymbiont]